LATHHEGILAICDALNLKNVSKLVLEISVGEPLRCYAVTYPKPEVYNPLVKYLVAAHVTDQADVVKTPLSMTQNAVMLANAVLAGDTSAACALADEIVAECGGK
jgi:hypothetical protein